jgi:diguanylate cyclase (GGDEF)-like protein
METCMQVLIADDCSTARRLLQALVEQWGYEVRLAQDGAEALAALLAEDGPALAILDRSMPGLDGVEVCRRIRERRGGRYVYVILLTASTGREHVVEALAAGADDYVGKPFDDGELEVRLRAGRRVVELEQRLRTTASYDALTGVWNRGAVREYLDQQLARSRREGTPLAVLLCDLDHFKRINDRHGHGTGDNVLREVAKRIRQSLRAYDGVGRYGGEEFLLVLSGIDPANARIVAERIRQCVCAGPVASGSRELAVTLSMGLACGGGREVDAQTLVRLADEALYRAKRAGRNRVEVAGPAAELRPPLPPRRTARSARPRRARR